MERGLLSDERLAAHYDAVVWMYLFQDFEGGAADRAAERVAIRFGISSWPQHLLVDPRDLSIVGDTGRRLDSFARAVGAARVDGELAITQEELRGRDALAERIMRSDGAALALEHLAHEDRVVRYLAVRRVAELEPARVLPKAAELLRVPHDQLRYVVCDVLRDHGDERFARALDALVVDPGAASRNPNVVRIHAARALGRCGDARSIAALAPHAASGNYRNGLTRVAVEAVAAIAARVPAARGAAFDALLGAFPAVPAGGDDKAARSSLHAATALARSVHEALVKVTGGSPLFPTRFDEDTRAALLVTWRDRRPR